jgi:outer membrane protein OmpA-like peptidoglycan-associated protein
MKPNQPANQPAIRPAIRPANRRINRQTHYIGIFHFRTGAAHAVRLLLLSVLLLILVQLPTSISTANILGTGTQNFNPVTDGLDYVTVHSTKTLSPGIINLGGFYNYAVNSLPYIDSTAQSHTKLSDTLTSSDFSFGLGILPTVDIGMSIPSVHAQSVENRTGDRGQFGDTGNTELRFNTKWRFSGDDDGGYAVVASANISRTRNDPYAGDGAGPTYNLEFVVDKTFTNKISGAANAGHRFRSPGSTVAGSFIEPMRNQWIASVAASYLFEQYDTKIIAELFGAVPAQQQGTNPARDATSAEFLLGVKHDYSQQLALHAGAGTELIEGVASPDWRAYVGLNYTFGPVWGGETASVAGLSSANRVKGVERYSIGSILFKFDSADMVNDYPKILSGLVGELKRQKFTMLTIEGHTDSVGGIAYNNDLSLRRANAIRDYLVKVEKMPEDKIVTAGLGPSRPIASNGNYQGRQTNRRVEFLIER